MAKNDRVELEVRINEAQANINRQRNQDRDVSAYRAHSNNVEMEAAYRRMNFQVGIRSAGMQMASTAGQGLAAAMNPFSSSGESAIGMAKGTAGALGTAIGAGLSTIPFVGGAGQAIGALLKQMGEQIVEAITAKFAYTDQTARGMMGGGLEQLAAAGVDRETLKSIMEARAPFAASAAKRQADLQEDLAKFDLTKHGISMLDSINVSEISSRVKEQGKQLVNQFVPEGTARTLVHKAVSDIGG